MTLNTSRNADTAWKLASVQKLQELWSAGVPANLIAQALGRPEHEIAAKASELKLPRH